MNLPFRNKGGSESNPVIPEMNGPAPLAGSGPGVRWGRVVILVAGALVVLVLLFSLGKWTFDSFTDKSSGKQTSGSSSTNKDGSIGPAPKTPGLQGGSSGSQQPSNSSGSASGTSSGSTSSNKPQSDSATGNLTNTGPGSTAAIFAIATAAGIAGYQIILRRQVSKN